MPFRSSAFAPSLALEPEEEAKCLEAWGNKKIKGSLEGKSPKAKHFSMSTSHEVKVGCWGSLDQPASFLLDLVEVFWHVLSLLV